MFNTRARGIRVFGCAILAGLAVGFAASAARAAGEIAAPELVGVLALAIEADVADKLGLTEGQRQKLIELVDARESEALELAIQLKNLPPAERAAKLAPFRRESESLGLALLSKQQRARLQQIRMARWGLAGALNGEVADKLKLSPQQQTQAAELFRQQAERLARADEKAAQAVRAETDRKLSSLLDPEQRAALEAMTASSRDRENEVQPKVPEAKPQDAAQSTPAPAPAKPMPAPEAAPKPSEPPAQAKVPEAKPQDAAQTTTVPEPAKPMPAPEPAPKPSEPPAQAKVPEAKPPGAGQTTTVPEPAKPMPAPEAAPKPSEPPAQAKVPEAKPHAETMPGGPGFAMPGPWKQGPPLGGPGFAPGPVKPVGPTERLAPAKPSDKLRFNFRYQPWKDVLDWFAETADLSLVGDNIPKGTFNYTDSREYTAAEAIDLLNGVLQTKGYTLVRKGRMLMVINLEDGIPPNLVETVPVEEIDKRGQHELIEVVFQLQNVSPEEVEQEINKLKGPQGSVTILPKSRQVRVIETGGRLRLIRQTIKAMENPQGAAARIRPIELQYADPQDALTVLRQLLDIPVDRNTSSDGSVHIVLDPMGGRLLVTGKPDAVARVEEIVKAIDVPDPANPQKTRLGDAPQLEVYAVSGADPNSVLQVLQTLLAGMPEVRLSVDPKTGNIIALGRRAAHATIKATIEQLQRDSRRLEVFPLRTLDPQLAVAAITKLFAAEAGPGAPKVDADPYSKRLLVRGSESQIEQIRLMLQQMGESGSSDRLSGSNLRVVPVTGAAARTALEGLEEMWPTVRPNRIRVVTPSAGGISTRRPSASSGSGEETRVHELPADAPEVQRESLLELLQSLRKRPEPEPAGVPPQPSGKAPPASPPVTPPPPAPPQPEAATPPGNKSAHALPETPRPRAKVLFTTQRLDEAAAPPSGAVGGTEQTRGAAPHGVSPGAPSVPVEKPSAPAASAPEPGSVDSTKPPAPRSTGPRPDEAVRAAVSPPAKPEAAAAPPPPSSGAPAKPTDRPKDDKPPVLVRPSPGGVIIASEDRDALDEIERLLTAMAGNFLSGKPELTVFYLKHAKASAVAETLDQILGGGTLGSSGGGGGSLLGDLAGAALGDMGGGLLGTLLGGGPSGGSGGSSSGTRTSGSVQITADNRLNALIVYAKPADLDTIEQLLKILDERQSPEEILAAPKPRLIPLHNTQAEEVANVVRQLYQDRMAGQSGAGRPPTPQDFIMAMRNMRGGRGGGSQRGGQEEPAKLSVSADPRTNSLIVVAPDSLFQEVKDLVEQLDEAAGDTSETLQVVTLQRANSETIRQALSAMVGSSVQFNRAGSSPSPSSNQPQQTPPFGFGRRGFGSPFGFPGGMGGSPFGFSGGMGGSPFGFPGSMGGSGGAPSPFGGAPGGGSPFSRSRGMFSPDSMNRGGSFGAPGSSPRGDAGRRSGRTRGGSSGGSRGR